ncbi:g5179 [Coccomyxa viridis]|uniref:Vesicle-fusing ATPase n=1 Tax=Coccomyxa viridis TaxID=1274662 RepID=A0ABP1FZ06_9CHLO
MGLFGDRSAAPAGAWQRETVSSPSNVHAKTNLVYLAPSDEASKAQFISINDMVFRTALDDRVEPGKIALSGVQRRSARISDRELVSVKSFLPPRGMEALLMTAALGFMRPMPATHKQEVDALAITTHLIRLFKGQVLTAGQELAFDYQGELFILRPVSMMIASSQDKSASQGLLTDTTAITFEPAPGLYGSGLTFKGQAMAAPRLFKAQEFNFESLGIGGLDQQFDQIFRRAFASRVFPPSMVERLGIRHVKGVLLFGPPGTGKTLIARQIGKMLNGKEPKIVNGPEILNKYVGASEENVRNLFKDAETEQAQKGDASELHVIIFDEIDAICKQRGSVSSGSGVHDTVVNQLLTKIDGVDALNNILLIGMTNRKDMLDEALLRPGRLEVQVEIGLADEKGRHQILQIHVKKMQQNSFLGTDVDLWNLAQRTKNFSGAEIEGLVKSATSFALNRQVDVNDLSKPIDEDNLKVCKEDFEEALKEVKPAFGAVTELLEAYRLNGIIDYGEHFRHLLSVCKQLVEQVRSSETTSLLTCLLEGPSGAGKTALAATLGLESEFPFVKVISSDNMVGYSEPAKCQQIAKVFDDAYRSPMSIIVLDDLERLLEYVPIGPRFSNTILQVLLVLLKKQPPQNRRLLVLGTTSAPALMEDMGFSAAFNVQLHVPALKEADVRTVLTAQKAFSSTDLEAAASCLTEAEVPIKRLLLLLELARQGVPEGSHIPLDRWMQVLHDLSLQ